MPLAPSPGPLRHQNGRSRRRGAVAPKLERLDPRQRKGFVIVMTAGWPARQLLRLAGGTNSAICCRPTADSQRQPVEEASVKFYQAKLRGCWGLISHQLNQRIALTLIELHADSHQNSCWLHSCEAADFVIDCAAKLAAQLINTGGGWQSRRERARGGPSRCAGGDWRLPRYALPRPTDELLHGRDLHHLCYHDSQS